MREIGKQIIELAKNLTSGLTGKQKLCGLGILGVVGLVMIGCSGDAEIAETTIDGVLEEE